MTLLGIKSVILKAVILCHMNYFIQTQYFPISNHIVVVPKSYQIMNEAKEMEITALQMRPQT